MSKGSQTQKEGTAAPMIAFARLTKVDEEKRLVSGRAAEQVPDRADEELDYAGSKPYFERWSKSQHEASMGKSVGNVRAMHGKIAAGILTPENGITFMDAEKAIDVRAHITDDQEWRKVMSGTYTGFSIGGKYVSKAPADPKTGVVKYVADPSEVSLVDRPAIPTATFFMVQKKDGTEAKVEFAKPAREIEKIVHPHKEKRDGKVVVVDDDGHEYGSHDDEDGANKQLAALYASKGRESKKMQMVRADGVDLAVKVDEAELPKPGDQFEFEGRSYALVKMDGDKAVVELIYEVSGSPDDIAAFAKALGDANLSISDATKLVLAKVEADAEKLKKVEAKARELCKASGKNPDDAIQEEGKPETKQPLWKGFEKAAIEALEKPIEPPSKEEPKADLAKLAGSDELAKLVTAEVTKVVAPVQKALDEATAKIKKLEDQPMPTKVQLALLTKSVGKEQDGAIAADGGDFKAIRDDHGRIDVPATIIKAMHLGAAGMAGLRKFVDVETGKLKEDA